MKRTFGGITALACVACLASCRGTGGTRGMDPYTKDVIDVVAKIVALVGVGLAAWGARASWRTRQEDLRWRMMSAANEALQDIHTDPHSSHAVAMLDCVVAGRPYNYMYKDGDQEIAWPTSFDDICAAIEGNGKGGHRNAWIYESFDWFIYYVDRIAHLDSERMLRAYDVGAPLKPYAALIMSKRACFEGLVRDHGYAKALPFLAKLAGPQGGRKSTGGTAG